jgi:AcrR family transcriptional regulator
MEQSPERTQGSGGSTAERILDAAEALLRRHGPAKTTVVDVARALGMSHANVYRHFASKADLRDAVAARWLAGIAGPLASIAAGPDPAPERLETWIVALVAAKRREARQDPELFATYHALAEAARGVVATHVAELQGQLARIIRDGAAAGVFPIADPEEAARAVFAATSRFHHPHFVQRAAEQPLEEQVRPALRLLIAGLRAGAA